MLSHPLIARLFFSFLVAALAVGLTHGLLGALAVHLGSAARALCYWALERFPAIDAIGHEFTNSNNKSSAYKDEKF